MYSQSLPAPNGAGVGKKVDVKKGNPQMMPGHGVQQRRENEPKYQLPKQLSTDQLCIGGNSGVNTSGVLTATSPQSPLVLAPQVENLVQTYSDEELNKIHRELSQKTPSIILADKIGEAAQELRAYESPSGMPFNAELYNRLTKPEKGAGQLSRPQQDYLDVLAKDLAFVDGCIRSVRNVGEKAQNFVQGKGLASQKVNMVLIDDFTAKEKVGPIRVPHGELVKMFLGDQAQIEQINIAEKNSPEIGPEVILKSLQKVIQDVESGKRVDLVSMSLGASVNTLKLMHELFGNYLKEKGSDVEIEKAKSYFSDYALALITKNPTKDLPLQQECTEFMEYIQQPEGRQKLIEAERKRMNEKLAPDRIELQILDCLSQLQKKGVEVVVSGGNDGPFRTNYMGMSKGIHEVGAKSLSGEMAPFSSRIVTHSAQGEFPIKPKRDINNKLLEMIFGSRVIGYDVTGDGKVDHRRNLADIVRDPQDKEFSRGEYTIKGTSFSVPDYCKKELIPQILQKMQHKNPQGLNLVLNAFQEIARGFSKAQTEKTQESGSVAALKPKKETPMKLDSVASGGKVIVIDDLLQQRENGETHGESVVKCLPNAAVEVLNIAGLKAEGPTDSRTVQALDEAIKQKEAGEDIRVVNMSFGGYMDLEKSYLPKKFVEWLAKNNPALIGKDGEGKNLIKDEKRAMLGFLDYAARKKGGLKPKSDNPYKNEIKNFVQYMQNEGRKELIKEQRQALREKAQADPHWKEIQNAYERIDKLTKLGVKVVVAGENHGPWQANLLGLANDDVICVGALAAEKNKSGQFKPRPDSSLMVNRFCQAPNGGTTSFAAPSYANKELLKSS